LGRRPAIYYWREHSGLEIDLVIKKDNRLIALEAKSGMTISLNMLSGLQKIKKTITDLPVQSLLIYGGDESHNIHDTSIASFRNFVSLIVDAR
jgi:predicted AAA+ superfamily ATPase